MVKVYLLLTQTGEENATFLPIVMSSNIPENISLKDLLSSVPDNYKMNIPFLDTASETGVSTSENNYSRMMDESFENVSHVNRKHSHQFTNKSKHLSDKAVKKKGSYKQNVILTKVQSKPSDKDKRIILHNLKQEQSNHQGAIENQSNSNKILAETMDSGNNSSEYYISSNVSQGVIHKRLRIKRSVNSSNKIAHNLQYKLNNRNETINTESNMKKNLSDAVVSGNDSKEEEYGNHDIKDVYYVVHTCSQKRCQIHQVVVLKRGMVKEEDMEAILQTVNQSQYSSHNINDWLNEWKVSFSDIINSMLHSHSRHIQWLLPVIFSLTIALLTKLMCDVYTYKEKVEMMYVFMEERIPDMKEMADIFKNYTKAQLILERRILLACSKETDNETQIKNMKNELAHLKITIRSMDGWNTVNMDDFVTAVLNYLQNCLESGENSITDEVQPRHTNVLSDFNTDCGQLT